MLVYLQPIDLATPVLRECAIVYERVRLPQLGIVERDDDWRIEPPLFEKFFSLQVSHFKNHLSTRNHLVHPWKQFQLSHIVILVGGIEDNRNIVLIGNLCHTAHDPNVTFRIRIYLKGHLDCSLSR